MTPPTLRRLPGPFDDGRAGPAAVPATPTCCCCCCCLVTMATSSTVAAVLVHHEAQVNGLPDNRRDLLTIFAALYIVVVWIVTGIMFRFGPDSGPFTVITLGTTVILWTVSLALLNGWAGAPPDRAWWRAIKIALITAVALTAEFVTIGLLVVGQLLAIPVPIIVGRQLSKRLRGQ